MYKLRDKIKSRNFNYTENFKLKLIYILNKKYSRRFKIATNNIAIKIIKFIFKNRTGRELNLKKIAYKIGNIFISIIKRIFKK